MATAPKKNAAAKKAAAAPTKSAPDEALVAPRAVFVMPEGAADKAEMNGLAESAAAAAAPVAEIQQSFRSALEKGVVESRLAFAKAKTAADQTANTFEVSFAAAKDGALAINAKAFETLRVNAAANFDFLKAVLGAKSLSDLITLQTEFARKQVETMTSQTRDFGALTQKAMADAVEPIKEQVAKSFKIAV
jgi:phasin